MSNRSVYVCECVRLSFLLFPSFCHWLCMPWFECTQQHTVTVKVFSWCLFENVDIGQVVRAIETAIPTGGEERETMWKNTHAHTSDSLYVCMYVCFWPLSLSLCIVLFSIHLTVCRTDTFSEIHSKRERERKQIIV